MRPLPTVVLIAALAAALLAPPALAAEPFKVWLKFAPHDESVQGSIASVGTLIGKTFKVGAVRDLRDADPAVLGNWTDAKGVRPIVAQTDPLAFAGAGIMDLLPRWGLTLVPANPDYVIDIDVVRLRVDAASVYVSDVLLHVTLKNARQELVWTGEVTGSSRVVGKPLKETNVNLALSDALKLAYWQFVSDPGLDSNVASGRVLKPAPVAKAPVAKSPNAMSPAAMLAELVKLNAAGIDEATQIDFVQQRAFTSELTADDVVLWRNAGLGEAVIRAALSKH